MHNIIIYISLACSPDERLKYDREYIMVMFNLAQIIPVDSKIIISII